MRLYISPRETNSSTCSIASSWLLADLCIRFFSPITIVLVLSALICRPNQLPVLSIFIVTGGHCGQVIRHYIRMYFESCYTSVCMNKCMYVCIYTYVYACMYVHINIGPTHIPVCLNPCPCVRLCVFMFAEAALCVRVCVCA